LTEVPRCADFRGIGGQKESRRRHDRISNGADRLRTAGEQQMTAPRFVWQETVRQFDPGDLGFVATSVRAENAPTPGVFAARHDEHLCARIGCQFLIPLLHKAHLHRGNVGRPTQERCRSGGGDAGADAVVRLNEPGARIANLGNEALAPARARCEQDRAVGSHEVDPARQCIRKKVRRGRGKLGGVGGVTTNLLHPLDEACRVKRGQFDLARLLGRQGALEPIEESLLNALVFRLERFEEQVAREHGRHDEQHRQ